MDIKNVSDKVEAMDKDVQNFINKTNEEISDHGKLGAKNAEQLKALEDRSAELTEQMKDIEQRTVAAHKAAAPVQSIGEQFAQSDALESMRNGGSRSAKFHTENSTITGSDTTVAPDRSSAVIGGAFRRLRVSEVIPTGSTSSNAIEYTKEATFTNNAAETAENVTKPETDLTFSLVNSPVRTIAHWIVLSKQVMDDAPMLASYVDTRMAYGVALRYDTQLAVGNGTAPNLSGLLDTGNYTVFTSTASDTATVSLRKAITQVEQADYAPTAVILNPADVQAIDLDVENTSVSLTSPRAATLPTIWGIQIVSSNAVAANQFVLGAFDMAAQAFVRQGTTVELFEQDSTNARDNLVTMRAEMRAALAIYRPASIVGGTLTS